jgi:hypothetical protein
MGPLHYLQRGVGNKMINNQKQPKYSDTIFDKPKSKVDDKADLLRRQFLKDPVMLKQLIKGMLNAGK